MNPPAGGGKNPRDVKAELAKVIVETYYTADDAEKASLEFDQVFSKRGKPSEIKTKKITKNNIALEDLLMDIELASSKSEARRLIEQGGVELDEEKITDPKKTIEIKEGMVIKVGKRNFVKLKR
ncbi:MAG: Tyrosine-tRNA ligase [Berkelbacteria bacterium GW2011_GWB1_38_5]|uniref:Tyrosine-tRNA ligase n=1 Tax=Berkelbacteria bacterium GW2011_GWB1_38_5 TaxID=1618336 RepID=A0A0G0MJI7_9BACT|nr:MAG: Tyrosine-tRNA ligase [Berkelbacteria bacterium GW2011_GWB1_38_5]